MTETNPEEIFKLLTASRILVAILQQEKQISVPSSSFVTLVSEDKQLQVDYDEQNDLFTFKIREENNEG